MTASPLEQSSSPETLGQSITNAVESVASAVTDSLSLSKLGSETNNEIPRTSLEGTKEQKITEGVGIVGMGAHSMAGSDAMNQMLGNEGNEPRQECLLFPTYGIPTAIDGQLHWQISVAGWLYANPPRSRMESLLMAAARRVAHVTSNSEQDQRLQERSRMFFTTTVRNIEVAIRTVGLVPALGQAYTSEGPQFGNTLAAESQIDPVSVSTGESGHFKSVLTVKADTFKEEPGKVLKIQTIYEHLSLPSYGVVDLIPETGISIISDIDDTIKVTNIPDGREVILENTFLNATQEVTGMSELYQKWASLGGHVHYVSNGPWQLFPMLSDFFAKFNFPPGSAHLRIIDRSDVVSTIRGPPGAHKLEAIPKIMNDFPKRKFILVGDTGELDPEVYHKIYEQFPDRIVKVFIHDVTSERAMKADEEAEARKAEAPKEGKKVYLESLREAIGLHATVTGEAHIAESAVDAVTSTEQPPQAAVTNDPNVPPPTKLELFHQRIAQVSDGMRDGVFKLFKDPKEIYEDSVVAAAFTETK